MTQTVGKKVGMQQAEKRVEPRAEQAADQQVVLELLPPFPCQGLSQKPEVRHSVCNVSPCRRFRT